MQLQPDVKKELVHIGTGCAVGTVVLVAGCALAWALGAPFGFSWKVPLSAVLGAFAAWLNFFGLALTLQKMAAGADEARGRSLMRTSEPVSYTHLVGALSGGLGLGFKPAVAAHAGEQETALAAPASHQDAHPHRPDIRNSTGFFGHDPHRLFQGEITGIILIQGVDDLHGGHGVPRKAHQDLSLMHI